MISIGIANFRKKCHFSSLSRPYLTLLWLKMVFVQSTIDVGSTITATFSDETRNKSKGKRQA